jgi:hydrogenase nickel incorporation protein HypA/HybF
MHELSIVEALLDAVRQEVGETELDRVTTVNVRLGQLRQVVPETLLFCFQAATQDTPLAGATLKVEQVPARARCQSCRQEFAVDERWFECPGCGQLDAQLLAGNELELVGIELAESQVTMTTN